MAGLVAVVIVMAICVLYYFLTFFLRYIFPARAAHSKSAMISVSSSQLMHFRMLGVHLRCVRSCMRGAL